jgi:elongation factor P--(R)-beta-lysine ligase
MPEDMPAADFRPTATWENLRLRARLMRRVRQFFDDREFLEVETPILSADTAIDRHVDPVPVTLDDSARRPGIPGRLWLQTSPEFGMKRLLAAGAKAIYQVTRVFRLGERGPLHNPEFTMVEWYRVGDGMQEGMRLLGELGECLLGRGAAETISYAEAFARHVGLDPHSASGAELASRARALKIPIPAGLAIEDRDAWLDLLVSERVQPNLGR